MAKVYTKTIRMSHDNLENAVTAFLYAMGELHDNEDVVFADFGLDVDEEGMVEFDLEVVANKPQVRLSVVK